MLNRETSTSVLNVSFKGLSVLIFSFFSTLNRYSCRRQFSLRWTLLIWAHLFCVLSGFPERWRHGHPSGQRLCLPGSCHLPSLWLPVGESHRQWEGPADRLVQDEPSFGRVQSARGQGRRFLSLGSASSPDISYFYLNLVFLAFLTGRHFKAGGSQ